MKKAIVTAVLFLTIFSAQADAATRDTRLCKVTTTGWRVEAGTSPRTSCGFATATYRAAKKKQREIDLPWRFTLQVRYELINCKVFTKYEDEILCKNPEKYVSIRYPWKD